MARHQPTQLHTAVIAAGKRAQQHIPDPQTAPTDDHLVPFACSLCEKAFTTQHALSTHVAHKHTSPTTWAISAGTYCLGCNKDYHTVHRLHRHLEKVKFCHLYHSITAQYHPPRSDQDIAHDQATQHHQTAQLRAQGQRENKSLLPPLSLGPLAGGN